MTDEPATHRARRAQLRTDVAQLSQLLTILPPTSAAQHQVQLLVDDWSAGAAQLHAETAASARRRTLALRSGWLLVAALATAALCFGGFAGWTRPPTPDLALFTIATAVPLLTLQFASIDHRLRDPGPKATDPL